MKIIGVGRYLPKRSVPSSEIEARCGLEPGWCERKQGVRERRWVEDETVSYMGAEAAREAVADAGIALTDIDLILNASHSFDRAVPEQGAQFQRELGLGDSGVSCMTINSGCLSFIMALNISASLLAIGRCRNILIVSVLISSPNLDFNNPLVCTMAGDAAAAVVVTRTQENETSGVHAMHMETYSQAADITGFSMDSRVFSKHIRMKDFTFNYDPKAMQTTGMKYNQKFLAKLWPMSNKDAINLVIPNQTTRFTLDMFKFIFPPQKIVGIIDRFGNCGAVGYPMALYTTIKEQERLKRGDMMLMTGMGAGFSLVGILLTY